MSKQTVNIVVNSASFAAMALLAATGSLMKFVLPPGSGHFSTVWGMDRHEWGDIHAWIAATLICLIATHVYLHWRWVASAIFGLGERRSPGKTLAAVAGLLILGAAAIAPFLASVEAGGEAPHRGRSREVYAPKGDEKTGTPQVVQPSAAAPGKPHYIMGSMTLLEVERATGVSAATIIAELKLPPDTSKDERLGRLRRQHGFEMHDVQAIVERHHGRQQSTAE